MTCYDKTIDNHLASIEGHIKAVREMVKTEKDCEEVLLQLSAIESSVNRLGKKLLKEHLNHCVKEGIQNGENDILDRFNTVLDKYL